MRRTEGCLTLPFKGCRSEMGPAAKGGDMILVIESPKVPDLKLIGGLEVLETLDKASLDSRPSVSDTIIPWGK